MRIGIDITHASRFPRILAKYDERFLQRCLSSDEMKSFRSSAIPLRFLASRWAAKEALIKALGGFRKQLPFAGVQIVSDGLGPPVFVALTEEWKKAMPQEVCLSISHDLDVAIAMVVIPNKVFVFFCCFEKCLVLSDTHNQR